MAAGAGQTVSAAEAAKQEKTKKELELFRAKQRINPALQPYTNKVVTLWYRSPELLFGTQFYGYEIDMWS